VLENAQPSFVAASTATAQTIDFGYVPVQGLTRSASFPVHNNPDAAAGAAFTASLDVDGVTKLGDASFATDVAPSDPANPLAAGASRISIASFTPPLAAGAYSATHTIATSDENIPGATAAASLVLTTTGRATAGVFPVSGDLFLFGNETFNTTSFALGDDVTVRKTGPGAMNINGAQSHPTSTTAHFIAEGGGAVRFDTDANATATTGLMVTARSTPITFNSRQHLRKLSVESSDVTVTPASGANTLVLGQLVDDGQSQVNLNDNNLILRAAGGGATVGVLGTDGAYTGVQGLVQRGYNFSAWDGDGLVTRTDDATVRGITTLAVATPADVFFIAPSDTMLWSGETVGGDDVLVMYTYAGDLNFDGLVDGADYGAIDNWVQFPGTGGYINGDFNYDGVIDGADYGIIDNTVQLQGPPIGGGGAFATASAMSSVTAVPEPAACGFALLAANFLTRRRRTRV
jgi:hypothetical protein